MIRSIPHRSSRPLRRRRNQPLFVAAFMVMLVMSGTRLAHACGAIGGDNRTEPEPRTSCEEPVSTHGSTQPGSATSNSVDIITGNKFFAQRDAYLPGGLSLVRSYNSRNTFKSALGPAWRHNFEATLTVRAGSKARAGSAQIVQGDGRRIVFKPAPAPNTGAYVALDQGYGTLHHQSMLGPDRRWRWQWRDGSRLTFSESGRLTMVARTDGRLLHLHYDRADGRLSRVSNRHGQSLRFQYHPESRQLTSVQLPDGQQLHYRYDAFGNLREVLRDDMPQWRFDYADDHMAAIVAVRNATDQVVRRVDYNEQGRAIYSALEDGAQGLRFSYKLPLSPDDIGETSIEPDAGFAPGKGQPTTYKWRYDPIAQRREMLGAQGPGCVGCPPVGVRQTYAGEHRPEQTIGVHGETSRQRFDQYGRLVSLTLEAGQSATKAASVRQIKASLPSSFRTRKTASAAPHVIRFHYTGSKVDAQPSRITQPSIAPGREHALAVQRDSLDRIIALTETGYAPELGSLHQSKNGWQFERWRKLSRTWSISYVDFGPAAGLPAFIDGPLPGLKDSIRFVYDRQGRRIAQFGPYRQSWHWRWHANGMLAEVKALEGQTQTFDYDRFNRLVSHQRDGVTTKLVRDDASRILTTRPSNRPEVSVRYNSRLQAVAITDIHGSRLLIDLVDVQALGRANGRQVPLAQSSGLFMGATRLQARPNTGEYKLRWGDDFGRTIAELDSVTGLRLYAYDMADRPIARIDESKRVQLYRYAPSGRFSGFAADESTGWQQRFKRGRVVRHDELHQQVRRKLDEHRRIVQTQINYQDKLSGQKFQTPLTLHQSYDERGRRHKRSIGRGWQLQYEWADTNELIGLALVRATDGARHNLVGGLRWQPFTGGDKGLRRALWANGTETRIAFDKALRVQQLEHRAAADGDELPSVAIRYGPAGRIIGRRVGAVDTTYRYETNGWLSGYQSAIGAGNWRYGPDGLRLEKKPTPAIKQVSHTKGLASSIAAQTEEQSGKVKVAPSSSAQSSQAPAPASAPASAPATASPSSMPIKGLVRSPTGATVALDNAGRPRWAATKDKRAFRYIYNRYGERIGKLQLGQPSGSRWFIYEHQRLSMETDANGKPLRAFIYLDDRPAAVVHFVDDDIAIHWVHTDAMGVPVAVTDAGGKITWKGHFDPFGQSIKHPENVDPGQMMPLRLAGQYYDEETGYHDNYLRTYDPTRGRYLGPDPLGLRASGLRYAYARNSPLDTKDPLGLYEIDMHYYATFVLAVAAGISVENARIIANTNQHVDDNEETRPISEDENGMDLLDTFLNRADILRALHFALEERVPNDDGTFRIDMYGNNQISNPSSPRLTELRNWVDEAGDENQALRFFRLGVYSHSYMDTASHRDRLNQPIPVSPAIFGIEHNGAIGHGPHGSYPDYTFNTCFRPAGDGELPSDDPDVSRGHLDWPNNESRTLIIQRDMYEIYREYAGDAEPRISWDKLAEVMREFNKIRESAERGVSDAESFKEKLTLLDKVLKELLGDLDDGSSRPRFRELDGSMGALAYDQGDASTLWARLFAEPGHE